MYRTSKYENHNGDDEFTACTMYKHMWSYTSTLCKTNRIYMSNLTIKMMSLYFNVIYIFDKDKIYVRFIFLLATLTMISIHNCDRCVYYGGNILLHIQFI